jgi:hypothetical protein
MPPRAQLGFFKNLGGLRVSNNGFESIHCIHHAEISRVIILVLKHTGSRMLAQVRL